MTSHKNTDKPIVIAEIVVVVVAVVVVVVQYAWNGIRPNFDKILKSAEGKNGMIYTY